MKESIKKFRNGIRHPSSTKVCARFMRESGKTHREIAKALNISLGSASLWTKNIYISPAQKIAIEKRRAQPYSTEEKKEELRKIIKVRLGPYQYRQKYTDESLLNKIIEFHKSHGRIPLKREFNQFAEYRTRFGSWNKAIKAAGFKPNKVIFSKRYKANDGHVCDSFAEKIIDDYLSKNSIEHVCHVPYPGTRMSADFVIKNVFVEYFGLAGLKSNYDRLIKEKRAVCKKANINLLEIYPSALFADNFEQFFIRVLSNSTIK